MSEISCKLPEKWESCINKIILKEGYTKYEIENKTISTNGGNYIGILNLVDVKGNTKEGEKETHLFVKSILPNVENIKMIPVAQLYNTELFVYNDLSKVFDELQNMYNVPIKDRYRIPMSYDESHSETLILENLAAKGFKTYHRMDTVSLKFAELSMEMLARFHGLGFVMQKYRPDYFNNNIKNKKHALIDGEDLKEFNQTMISTISSLLDDEIRERFRKVEKNFGKQVIKHCTDQTVVCTMCHGDYRPMNILTKFVDGEATEIVPIDYQILHYGCPVNDIIYFLYNCTDRDFRKSHLSHLKDLYHKTMTSFLKYFDIDINTVFPKEEFLKVYNEKLEMALSITVVFLPFAFAREDDLPDLTGEGAAISFKPHNRLKPRVQGAFDEFVEWGLI